MGNHYYHTGSVYIQGSPGRPLIILLPGTIKGVRDFQNTHPRVDVTVLINEAIILAIEEKEQSIRSLERVGDRL